MSSEKIAWKEHLDFGEGYHLQASSMAANKKFTNDVIFNIYLIAIENYLIGFLQYHHTMPEGSRIDDILRAVNEIKPLPPLLVQQLLSIDGNQDLCSLETMDPVVISDSELVDLGYVTKKISEFVLDETKDVLLRA